MASASRDTGAGRCRNWVPSSRVVEAVAVAVAETLTTLSIAAAAPSSVLPCCSGWPSDPAGYELSHLVGHGSSAVVSCWLPFCGQLGWSLTPPSVCLHICHNGYLPSTMTHWHTNKQSLRNNNTTLFTCCRSTRRVAAASRPQLRSKSLTWME